MNDILRAFMNVRVKRLEGSYLLNKPLLLLLTLGRCQQRKDRLVPFSLYEDTLLSVSHDFGRLNAVFPFGRLLAGLTGGMSCEEAQKRVVTSMLEGPDRGSVGLERILFSESFFGYRSGKPWLQAEGLHAVAFYGTGGMRLLRKPMAKNYGNGLSLASK